jgi:hypothetical protein
VDGFPAIAGHDCDEVTSGFAADALLVEAVAATGDINVAAARPMAHEMGPKRRAELVLRIPIFPPEMT